MLCKPSFPSPHLEAVDVTNSIIFQATNGEGVINKYKLRLYNNLDSSLAFEHEYTSNGGDIPNLELTLNDNFSGWGVSPQICVFCPESGLNIDDYDYLKITFTEQADSSLVYNFTINIGYHTEYDIIIYKDNTNTAIVDLSKYKASEHGQLQGSTLNWIKCHNDKYRFTTKTSNVFEKMEVVATGSALNSFPIYGGTKESTIKCSVDANGTLDNGVDYKWNFVLYEDIDVDNPQPTILTNYGKTMADSTEDTENQTTTITVRPDTSLVVPRYDPNNPNYNPDEKYYIKVNGETHRIRSYTLIAEPGSMTGLYSSATLLADGLFETTIPNGTYYTIYSNFVVSDDFMFYARTEPVLSLTVQDDTVSTNIESPTSIETCSADIRGMYQQQEGVGISRQELLIYDLSGVEEKLVYTSSEIFSNCISYSYNSFLGGNLYKLQLKVIDEYGRETFSEPYYIKADYPLYPAPYSPVADVQTRYSSVFLDWRSVKSIVPDITQEESIEELFVDANGTYEESTAERNAVHLGHDSSLSWIADTKGIDIPITHSTEFIWEGTVEEGFSGTILEIESDVGEIAYIKFDGEKFLLKGFEPDETEYIVYTGGDTFCLSPSVIADKRYVWSEGLNWIESSGGNPIYYNENDLISSWWWKITLSEGAFTVDKIIGAHREEVI